MSTYSPIELAYKLGYTGETRPGRVVRAYLREKYPDTRTVSVGYLMRARRLTF